MISILVFVACVGIGIAFFVIGFQQHRLQRDLTDNPQRVTATIIRSEVKTHRSSDTDSRLLRDNSTTSHDPEVRFKYTIDGVDYESDLLRPSEIVRTYASKSSAEEELRAFPLGAQVQAFYSPLRPDRAYLVAEETAGPMVFMILGFVVPGVGFLVARYLI